MPQPHSSSLQKSLQQSAKAAKMWFFENARKCAAKDFDNKGSLDAPGTGAVYLYRRRQGRKFVDLYVGETGRTIKSRQHDETSAHKTKPWWKDKKNGWTELRYVYIENQTDRLTLELLLILALNPKYNKKPGQRAIKDMFSS